MLHTNAFLRAKITDLQHLCIDLVSAPNQAGADYQAPPVVISSLRTTLEKIIGEDQRRAKNICLIQGPEKDVDGHKQGSAPGSTL